jgi:uncharacterized phage protein gp47/JayE
MAELLLLPPTGLRIESYVRDNIVEWLGSDDPSVVGYNVYVSSTSGGGQSRYLRLNNVVIAAPYRTEDIVEEESSDTVETMLGAGSGEAEQTTVIRKKVRKAPVFRLRHRNVDINSKQFYVVTSVDASGSESGYSTELTGETTRIDSQVVHVPPREFNAIVNGMIDTFLRRDPEVDLKPGTVFRDLVIDPPAFEMEKLWFFLNFIDKATSMVALRAVDDENDDSISDPVSQSDYKQRLRAALSLTSDEDTQTLIDYAMEKLASNARVFRKGATRAQGEIVFYASARPTGDIEIPAGTSVWTASTESGAVIAFSTTVSVNVSAGDLDLRYSAANARYEFAAPIVASASGPGGNVSAGAIVKATTGQFAVTNPAPTFGGDVQENNSLFSERAVLKMSSLDVGTRKGYRRVLIEQPGVLDVYVAAAADALMQRDFMRHISPDGSAKSEHIFGKVDAWVRGGESVIFEDRAGFLYDRVEGEGFKVVERVSAFTIETTNPAVSEAQPIFDVERITRRRPGVPDADYTLDNLLLDDGGRRLTIDTLDATNVAIGLKEGDAVTATYRFRGSSPIVLLHQPATAVVSVEGLNSGPLDEGTHYEFLQRDDFLLNGRSVRGGSAVHLKYDGPSRKPIGTIESFSERTGNHAGFVLTQEFRALSKRGIVSGSIVVKTIPSAGGSPVALELNRHYVVETDPAGVASVKLIGNDSRFTPGVRYAVSYRYGEEIIIRYRANNLVGRLQAVVDRSKHEAADVLVKSAIPVDIDIVFSFKVMPSSDILDVKQAVGAAARSFVAGRRLGESVYESDLIYRVQQVAGVKHMILPMSKLGRTSGNYETETIRSAWSEVSIGTDESGSPISYWQTQQNALGQNTLGTSAEPNEFWGLRENGTPLEVVADLTALVAKRGTFFIDATGTVFVNPKSTDEIGNPFNDRDPNANEYRVTYRIAGESGSQDIVIQPNEYARLADFIIEAVEG